MWQISIRGKFESRSSYESKANSYRSLSVGTAVEDVGDVAAESVVAEKEVIEVGAHVVHLTVAILARRRAAVRFLLRSG